MGHEKDGKVRLLIVDDEAEMRRTFRAIAERLGFEVSEAAVYAEIFAQLDQHQPAAILLDLSMPDTDGVEVLRELAARRATAEVILTSGWDARLLTSVQRLGRESGLRMPAVLPKPVSVAALSGVLERVRGDTFVVDAQNLRQAMAELTLFRRRHLLGRATLGGHWHEPPI